MNDVPVEETRRGFTGVVAAIAAILTAVGGIIAGINQMNRGDQPPTQIVMSAPPPPTHIVVQIDPSELTAVAEAEPGMEVDRMISACAEGDEEACHAILDGLAAECQEGYVGSCDVLYEVTAAGSDLEDWAARCGGRLDGWDYAGTCEDVQWSES